MDNFQLWSRDEYGQGQIHKTSDKVEDLVSEAKRQINEVNVNNALTVEDKKRNWESYMVEPVSETEDLVYGGMDTLGAHVVYSISPDGTSKKRLEGDVKIYLGKLDDIDWYASNPRGEQVTSLKSTVLEGKMVYFVKKV
ncbi:MAG: hypothetical protein J7L15_07450 [Clostridiales bacterium]|nr:hypothetical protein [Clostridiales bacterium]